MYGNFGCMYVYVPCVCKCQWRPEEGVVISLEHNLQTVANSFVSAKHLAWLFWKWYQPAQLQNILLQRQFERMSKRRERGHTGRDMGQVSVVGIDQEKVYDKHAWECHSGTHFYIMNIYQNLNRIMTDAIKKEGEKKLLGIFGRNINEAATIELIGRFLKTKHSCFSLWSSYVPLMCRVSTCHWHTFIIQNNAELKESTLWHFREPCTPMFSAALFTIGGTWSQPQYQIVAEKLRKMWNLIQC